MDSQAMNNNECPETEQSKSPNSGKDFSMLMEKNESMQNMQQDRARKRPFEGLCAGEDVSPRKAAKKENEKDDDHSVMTESAIYQRKSERMRKHRNSLAWKSATLKQGTQMLKNLRLKEELIASLELKVKELQEVSSQTDLNVCETSGDGQLSSTQGLLNIIRRLETENENLRVQVSDLEANKNVIKDTHSMQMNSQHKSVEHELVDLKFLVSQQEKQIQLLETQKDCLHQQLQKLQGSQANERKLCRTIDDLKLTVIDKELECVKEQIKLTEYMANTPSMVIIESKAPMQYNTEIMHMIQDKLKYISTSYDGLRKLVVQFPSFIESAVKEARLKMEEAVMATAKMNKELVSKYTREAQLRKHYHNQLVVLRGNIRVFCRVRPCLTDNGATEPVISFDTFDDGIIMVHNKGRVVNFDMDKVFSMNISQSQIFDEVSSLVRSVIDGFNVCIFAYGQTGSGKTHTMEGIPSDPGVNQRALQLLYEETKTSCSDYSIEASMLEIYNETLIDLLNPELTSNNLEVKMKQEGGFHVPGLVTVPVTSLNEINKIIKTGHLNRTTASTCMNERSSRSHSLLCVNVTGVNRITGSKTFGRLNLVDLAGSERVSRSQADGVHLKEAQNINKSLSSLGDVINALKNKHAHVPYRNSKLTYMLQESLGGDSKTLMILQVSPEEEDVSESICTLTFGQRVRSAELGAAKRKFEDGTKIQKHLSFLVLRLGAMDIVTLRFDAMNTVNMESLWLFCQLAELNLTHRELVTCPKSYEHAGQGTPTSLLCTKSEIISPMTPSKANTQSISHVIKT